MLKTLHFVLTVYLHVSMFLKVNNHYFTIQHSTFSLTDGAQNVPCKAGTKSLYIMYTNFSLKDVINLKKNHRQTYQASDS